MDMSIYNHMKEADVARKQAAKPVAAPTAGYVPIPEVGASYRLFKDGRIASLNYLKPHLTKKGFLAVNIRDDEGKQRTYLLHMLVARAHVDNPLNRTHVRFVDGNKLNCSADNLEWV